MATEEETEEEEDVEKQSIKKLLDENSPKFEQIKRKRNL
jgi:hypothetical protein